MKSFKEIKNHIQTLHSSQIGSTCAEYITPTLYASSPDEAKELLTFAYYEILSFDDWGKDELTELVRAGLINSNFEWYPPNQPSDGYILTRLLIKKNDSEEHKIKLVNSLTIDTLRKSVGTWPGPNDLNLELSDTDCRVINSILPNLLNVDWTLKKYKLNDAYALYYMIDYVLKNEQVSEESKRNLKLHILTLYGSHLVDENLETHYPKLIDIAKELLGTHYKQIIQSAQTLGLTGDMNFWASNKMSCESIDLDTISF